MNGDDPEAELDDALNRVWIAQQLLAGSARLNGHRPARGLTVAPDRDITAPFDVAELDRMLYPPRRRRRRRARALALAATLGALVTFATATLWLAGLPAG